MTKVSKNVDKQVIKIYTIFKQYADDIAIILQNLTMLISIKLHLSKFQYILQVFSETVITKFMKDSKFQSIF